MRDRRKATPMHTGTRRVSEVQIPRPHWWVVSNANLSRSHPSLIKSPVQRNENILANSDKFVFCFITCSLYNIVFLSYYGLHIGQDILDVPAETAR